MTAAALLPRSRESPALDGLAGEDSATDTSVPLVRAQVKTIEDVEAAVEAALKAEDAMPVHSSFRSALLH